jgi:hypothetical protein
MSQQTKTKIRWHNKVEKFASEQDRVQGKPQEVIEWETEDELSLGDALALGFEATEQEVNQHGIDPSR